MKLSTPYSAFILAGAALLFTAMPAANAQNSGTLRVPFAFQCGPSHMAAGTYTISSGPGHSVSIRGQKTTNLAMALTYGNDKLHEKGRAVFVRAAGRYYLDDMWVPGSNSHLHFINSKPKTRNVVAAIEPLPPTVELAMLEPLR